MLIKINTMEKIIDEIIRIRDKKLKELKANKEMPLYEKMYEIQKFEREHNIPKELRINKIN